MFLWRSIKMLECPVCKNINSESSKNCEKCGFDLKYVRGYCMDISDEDLKKYQKELREARRVYEQKSK